MAKYTNKSTGSAYGDKAKSDWERQQKKKGFDREAWEREQEENYGGWVNPNGQKKTKKSTIEAKEKAKTKSVLEKAFAGNTTQSAPPSKEEQERLRKQGSRNAANQYSKSYSGPANNYSRSNSERRR